MIWLIETNSFLIGEFIFILNSDWMGRTIGYQCPSIISTSSRQRSLLKETEFPQLLMLQCLYNLTNLEAVYMKIKTW